MNKIPCMLCKHPKNAHQYGPPAGNACWDCINEMEMFGNCQYSYLHNFISDNLTYIEQLAKEKGLV